MYNVMRQAKTASRNSAMYTNGERASSNIYIYIYIQYTSTCMYTLTMTSACTVVLYIYYNTAHARATARSLSSGGHVACRDGPYQRHLRREVQNSCCGGGLQSCSQSKQETHQKTLPRATTLALPLTMAHERFCRIP